MKEQIIISSVSPQSSIIPLIADWYCEEWNIPRSNTLNRLETFPNEDVLSQLAVIENEEPIATGGLYNNVGLFKSYPEFQRLKPWVVLLYTKQQHRNRGIGKLLLTQIEKEAKQLGYDKIYLFTFTAEALYKKCGWMEVERVDYKGNDTVIMMKEI